MTAIRALSVITYMLLGVLPLLGTYVDADDSSATETRFLDALVGHWHGRAVRTPRGPLPYDIEFRRKADGGVTGIAYPGAAQHHWTFFKRENELRLRFLTTFAGNADPVWLTVIEETPDGTLVFKAEDPPYLLVRVRPGPESIDIFITLHGEPHVDIQLTSYGSDDGQGKQGPGRAR